MMMSQKKNKKTVLVPAIHAATKIVDELVEFAQDELEEMELVISFNSVCRLLQKKTLASQAENITDYFFEQTPQHKHFICQVTSYLLK